MGSYSIMSRQQLHSAATARRSRPLSITVTSKKKKQVPVNEAFAHKPHASSILYPSFLPLDSIVTIKKKFDTLVFCIAYFY